MATHVKRQHPWRSQNAMAIKFCPLLAALALCAQVLSISAHAMEPKFQDYKVDSVFAGPNHALDVPDQGKDN